MSSIITASASNPTSIDEGQQAVATFIISPALSADAVVGVSLSGYGTSAADYSGFQYSLDGSTWLDVPASNTITLTSGLGSFKLRTQTNTDSEAWEVGESVNFVVSQQATSSVLTDSWWVYSAIGINNVAAPAPAPTPATASLSALVASVNVTESGGASGIDAISKFQLSNALAQDATFTVGLHGWTASAADDFSGSMAYRTATNSSGTLSAWTTVASGATLTIPAGHTYLEVRNTVKDDTLLENSESAVVYLQQTSTNLTDSWWVTSTVAIADNDAAPSTPTLNKVSISAGAATTVVEGGYATASYTLSGALAADAKVTIMALGWDATAGQDYDGQTLGYRLKDASGHWGTWQTAANLAQVTLAQGTTALELRAQTHNDIVTPEANETLQFVVTQSAESGHVLENSWWQSSLATIIDSPNAYIRGTATGAVTEDGTQSAAGSLIVFDSVVAEAAFRPLANVSGTYGQITLNSDGAWIYTLNNSSVAVQALKTGDVVTDTFTATSVDGSATQAITITVNGANDTAVIGGVATGTVKEDAAPFVTNGTLTIIDADAGQAAFQAQSNVASAWGSFSVTTQGAWSYTLNNVHASVQALNKGQHLEETFTVTSADGSSTGQVTVTIQGENEGKHVAVLTDPTVVDVYVGGSWAEATNVVATIAGFGSTGGVRQVSTLSSIGDAALASALTNSDVFVVPEMEIGSWGVTSGAESLIENFVDDGGTLIVQGDYSGRASAFLNTVFEWSSYNHSSGQSTKTSAGSGLFPSTVNVLPWNDATVALTSLPTDAITAYQDYSGAATVATWSYGDGAVVFLGWDWFYAAPNGSQDGGWNAVLNAAILL